MSLSDIDFTASDSISPSSLPAERPDDPWTAGTKPIEHLFPEPQPVEETTTFDTNGRPVEPSTPPAKPPVDFTMQPVFDLFGTDPAKVKEAQDKSISAQLEKMQRDGASEARNLSRMYGHAGQMQRVRDAEAHTLAGMPPPWDADKESATRIRGPIESFGSVASIFALAAAAFTRQPALNALSASAAAMTAIHESDYEGYERAYKAWKDNTELMQKRFNMERELFNDTATLFNTDATLWKAETAANAARFGDQRTLALLEAGLDGEVFKLMESKTKAFEQSMQAKTDWDNFHAAQQFKNETIATAEREHPDWTPAQKAQYSQLVLNEATPGKTVQQNLVAKILREKFNKTGELTEEDLRNADYLDVGRRERTNATLASRERIAQLSNSTKREIATLSDETKREIAQQLEEGRDRRAELSADARREIATMSVESREEIARMLEEGRGQRQTKTEEGRDRRQDKAEEGKRERLEYSTAAKDALQQTSLAARRELEELRQGHQDYRAEMSDGTRREMAQMNREQRLAIIKELEEGREKRLHETLASLEKRAQTKGAAAQKQEDKKADTKKLADGIESGILPPNLSGFYQQKAPVEAELSERKFDLSKAVIEWRAAEKQISTLNGPQMTRFSGLAKAVVNTIDEVRELSKEMQLSGIPLLNKAKLVTITQTQGNTAKGQLVAKYLGAVNTLKEEFTNLAQGGYAPTESAWKLANQQINSDYGVKQLGASLDEVQRLIRYRVKAMPGLEKLGPTGANRYTGSTGGDVMPDTKATEYEETRTLPDGKTYGRKGKSWFPIKDPK